MRRTPPQRRRFSPPRPRPPSPPARADHRAARRGAIAVQLVPEPLPVSFAVPAPEGRQRLLLLLGLLAIAGCSREDVVHATDEAQANAVLVALDGRGIGAQARGDSGRDGGWVVSVPAADAAAARRALADEELPRARAPGLGEVFGKPGIVPTPLEERARYLHALSGELARSVESIDGVAEARVHLALAPDDPLRAQAPPPPRAAVLVKVRPGLRDRVEPMTDGIRSLVAGSIAGLDAATVSVVLSEALPRPQPAVAAKSSWRRTILLALAGLAALCALALVAWPQRERALALVRRS